MSHTLSATQVMFLLASVFLLARLCSNCSTDLAKFDRMMASGSRGKPLDIGDNHVTLRWGLVAVKWGQFALRFTVTCCRITGLTVTLDRAYVLTELKGAAVGPRWRYIFYCVPFRYLNGSTPCNVFCLTKL